MAHRGSGRRPSGGRFGNWLSSGLLATVAWFIVLVIYCTFKAIGIDDPILGQVFMLLTGVWVGALTLAQGKKSARVEEKLEKLERSARSEDPDTLASERDE